MYPASSLWYPPLVGSEDSTLIPSGKTFILTRSQADYINKNHLEKPKVVTLWMEIDDYLAKEYGVTIA